MSEIDLDKYFKFHRNENGFTYCIEQIGYVKELTEEIRQQNEQLQQLKQENEELRQVNKDVPDIQEPYVILYRKLKKELYKAEQKLEKIKEIAKDIIKNDCYENSDVKAENILQIIESEQE